VKLNKYPNVLGNELLTVTVISTKWSIYGNCLDHPYVLKLQMWY